MTVAKTNKPLVNIYIVLERLILLYFFIIVSLPSFIKGEVPIPFIEQSVSGRWFRHYFLDSNNFIRFDGKSGICKASFVKTTGILSAECVSQITIERISHSENCKVDRSSMFSIIIDHNDGNDESLELKAFCGSGLYSSTGKTYSP